MTGGRGQNFIRGLPVAGQIAVTLRRGAVRLLYSGPPRDACRPDGRATLPIVGVEEMVRGVA